MLAVTAGIVHRGASTASREKEVLFSLTAQTGEKDEAIQKQSSLIVCYSRQNPDGAPALGGYCPKLFPLGGVFCTDADILITFPYAELASCVRFWFGVQLVVTQREPPLLHDAICSVFPRCGQVYCNSTKKKRSGMSATSPCEKKNNTN